MNDGKVLIPVQTRLERDLFERFQAEAKRNHRSLAAELYMLIEAKLGPSTKKEQVKS